MATSKAFKDYILEQINYLQDIRCRSMMGGYLLYYKDILFGGLYRGRFLVKKVTENAKYNLQDAIPYEGAKLMYLVDKLDDKELIKQIIIDTYLGLIKR